MSAPRRTARAKEVVQIVTATPAEQKKLDREWAEERLAWGKLRPSLSAGGAVVPLSREKEIAKLAAQCHQVIRASASLHGWEGAQDDTPLHEIVDREAADPETNAAMRARQENFQAFLRWCFGSGPHPSDVMKRVFMLAYQQAPELIAHMNMADLGLLLGVGKAAVSWRVGTLFEGKLRSRSQKREGSRPVYAAAAMGNKNRRRGEQRKKRSLREQARLN